MLLLQCPGCFSAGHTIKDLIKRSETKPVSLTFNMGVCLCMCVPFRAIIIITIEEDKFPIKFNDIQLC